MSASLSSAVDGVLENVTIRVVGGTVLPRLRVPNVLTQRRNIVLYVVDVVAVGLMLTDVSSSPLTLLDMSDLVALAVLENISVQLLRTKVSWSVEASNNGIRMAPLLYVTSVASNVSIRNMSVTL